MPSDTVWQSVSWHNLPVQLSSFIGREQEITEVRRVLASSRLVTLTGVGGCGKTRLALQVAAEVLHLFANAVGWPAAGYRISGGQGESANRTRRPG